MKRVSFLFSILAILLSACGTPQLAPTATRVPTATQTQTPIPSNTPTPTLTPIPTVPETTSEFFKNIDWSDFVLVTHEERLVLNDRFMNDQSQWKLSSDLDSIPRPSGFATNVYPDGTSVNLNCHLSITCIPHYVVVENTAEGSLYIIIWELITKGLDGKNIRVSLSTAFVQGITYKDWQLEQIRKIGLYGATTELNLNLVINSSDPNSIKLGGALLVDDPARLALTKGIIDEQTSDILMWTTAISSCPCPYDPY
jgi:hypothetical protein